MFCPHCMEDNGGAGLPIRMTIIVTGTKWFIDLEGKDEWDRTKEERISCNEVLRQCRECAFVCRDLLPLPIEVKRNG